MKSKTAQQKASSVPPERPATLTINQAHAMIGEHNITRQSLYLAAARGELPSIRLGKRVLIPRMAFERWLSGEKPASAA